MFNGPPLNITVVPLVLSNKHPQYLIYCNCLLIYSNAMSYESGCHFSPLLQFTTATIFYTTINKINRYGFCILYLPSELKTSITFIARTMETHGPSIVLITHKCLLACDMRFLADTSRYCRRLHYVKRTLHYLCKSR